MMLVIIIIIIIWPLLKNFHCYLRAVLVVIWKYSLNYFIYYIYVMWGWRGRGGRGGGQGCLTYKSIQTFSKSILLSSYWDKGNPLKTLVHSRIEGVKGLRGLPFSFNNQWEINAYDYYGDICRRDVTMAHDTLKAHYWKQI